MAAFLGQWLGDYLAANPLPGEVLVPVPLHHKRLRERGYNQSRLLALELGKLSGLPLVDDCLVRERYTTPQARTPSVDERRSNVADAFACRDRRLEGRAGLAHRRRRHLGGYPRRLRPGAERSRGKLGMGSGAG